MTVKALHDGRDVFFLLQVDGDYAYTQGDNKKCRSMALMFQIGDSATYHNMGGCKEGTDSCNNKTCKGHEVDIMHFSIGNAIPGRLYGGNPIDNGIGNGGLAIWLIFMLGPHTTNTLMGLVLQEVSDEYDTTHEVWCCFLGGQLFDLCDPVRDSNNATLGQSRNDHNRRTLQPILSNEELKIRSELEMETERGLEEEIKDEIYHLALRLRRLYKHKQERQNKSLSEVVISIKFDGETTIEIKETKKPLPLPFHTGNTYIRPRTAKSEQLQVNFGGNRKTKKFDWAESLRSNSSPFQFWKW